jgi:hypothetical protein
LGGTLCKQLSFLFPCFFPILRKRNISMGTWERWRGSGEPYTNNSLFISSLLSNFIKKKYFHGNMGTLGTFCTIFRSRLQTQNCHIIWSLYQSTSSKGTVSCTGALFTCFACGCSSNASSHNKHNPEPVPDYWVLTWWGFLLACPAKEARIWCLDSF